MTAVEAIEIVPLPGTLGAQVVGVDLYGELSDARSAACAKRCCATASSSFATNC